MKTFLTRLVILVLLVTMFALPSLAQDAPGLDVDVDASGVSIYRINSDGSRTLLVFVASQADATINAEAFGLDDVSTSIDGYLIVNTKYLNVRSGDHVGYTSLGVVSGGDRLEVIGRNDAQALWWFVDAGGTQGWVNNVHVFVRGDLSDVPIVPVDGELILPSLYIGFTGNPLWRDLDGSGDILCLLNGGQEYTIIGRSAGGNWYQIVALCGDDAIVGWIQADRGVVRNPASLRIPVTYP